MVRAGADEPGQLVPHAGVDTLVYLDGDPLTFAEALADHPPDRVTAEVETLLFAGPLRTIIPWESDWFD